MHEPTSSHLIANLGMAKAAYPSHAVVWVYLSTSFPNRILAPRRGDPRIRPDCQSKRNFFRHGRARPVGRLFWWLARSNKVRVMHTKKNIVTEHEYIIRSKRRKPPTNAYSSSSCREIWRVILACFCFSVLQAGVGHPLQVGNMLYTLFALLLA